MCIYLPIFFSLLFIYCACVNFNVHGSLFLFLCLVVYFDPEGNLDAPDAEFSIKLISLCYHPWVLIIICSLIYDLFGLHYTMTLNTISGPISLINGQY